jgi:ethanolamine utilization protein EutA
MATRVKLLGLDFGTTTSSAVVAEGELTRNTVTGRTDLAELREVYRSDMVFTPVLDDDRLDLTAIAKLLDGWLEAGGVDSRDLFGGGALLTGLTAQKDNAPALVALIRRRLGDTLIATADDPCLEAWMAFMGKSAALSRDMPRMPVLNLDIGGGTTNLALGLNGEVQRTGCLRVGARHVQVRPGSYKIVKLSRFARALFAHLGLAKDVGAELLPAEVDRVLDFYLDLLDASLRHDHAMAAGEGARLHTQVPFRLPAGLADYVVTVSGGVGELIGAHLDGAPWPATTCFGDLGIDLARRLVASARWGPRLHYEGLVSAGRATVYGLLRYSTQISGSTLFLPDAEVLPLNDLPILGCVSAASVPERMDELLTLAARSPGGACLRVELEGEGESTAAVRTMGRRFAEALERLRFPRDRPLVLVLRENLGKVLGHYVTAWGDLAVRLVVIDEVADRDAQFARLGRMRQQVVPVSFYGLAANAH